MYCPAHFAETQSQALHALLREQPLATLVIQGGDGLLANHLPLLLETPTAAPATLCGHVARANPLWREIAARGGEGVAALAIFHGPQHYISPNWYPGKREHGRAVPTWNYAVVHAHGRLRAVDDADWLRRQLDLLTRQEESGFAAPWALADAPADYIEQMLRAVVGVELTIERLEGKWKTSQNQPPANRAGVVAGLGECGGDAATAMAALVARHDRPD